MASDYFLKIKDVEGEALAEGHAKEIELLSWSWGASNPGGMHFGSGGGTGKVSVQDLSFAFRVGKETPKLIEFCCTGKHISDATLTARKTGGDAKPYDYITIKLTDCVVASYQTGGSGGDDVPVDSASLNFAKIEYDYKIQDSAKGTVASAGKTTYDVQKEQKS
ncbi:MAG: Hcp family type VI secretion system effector [Terriglobia bacterium]